MALSLKPLATLLSWPRKAPHADELYGVIVAQARLPIFYQRFGVPDTLEGRFVVLSLHLFAVLHRLKDDQSPEAARLAQNLVDRFTADMETVLRELGVGDLSIPKKVRKLVGSGAAQLERFEQALAEGRTALARAISAALPGDEATAQAASAKLAPYVERMIRHLEAEPVQDLCAGRLRVPEI